MLGWEGVTSCVSGTDAAMEFGMQDVYEDLWLWEEGEAWEELP